MVFTWLVQPRELDGDADWLPYAAVGIGATAVLTMMLVLRREGLGPLAKRELNQ